MLLVLLGCIVFLGMAFSAWAAADDDFGNTPYVPTPQNIVDRMLQVAQVGPSDYVIDLGSGDGRMIITAAKKHGARGFGVDHDQRLVDLSNRLAQREGVADRAVFYARDLYETDLSEASVVTIYLLPEVNLMVRPKLLSTLKPGTRVVSHDYNMGEWPPDDQMVLDAPDKPVGRDKKSAVYFWVVPGNAAGVWRWQIPIAGKSSEFEFAVSQNFQKLDATLKAGATSWPVESARLRGELLSFVAHDPRDKTRYEFSGRLNGGILVGEVRVSGPNVQRQLQWDALRAIAGRPAHAALTKPDIRELQKQMQP